MKAKAGGSGQDSCPGTRVTGVAWLKGLSGLGRGLLRQEWGLLGGRQQERPRREKEGGTALEIPSARTSSLGHIPAATSLSPSVSPPPTSSSHFHMSHTPDTS